METDLPLLDLHPFDLHAIDLPALRRRTSDLLAAHVPLTLLMDLADPAGPTRRPGTASSRAT